MLPNSQVPQSNLEKTQIPLNSNVGSNENCDDVVKNSTILSSNVCDIPMVERLSYVMTSLNDSIQKSSLPEVNSKYCYANILICHLIQYNM